MTRVAYIGNFEPPHSTENEVLRALRSLGHDVQPIQENDRDGWLRIFGVVGVDVILWTRTRSLSDQVDVEIRWETLAIAKRHGIPTVGYHLDRWWGLQREHEIHEDPFFRVSLLCTADGGHDHLWSRNGVNHAWFPPAVSEFECGFGTPVIEYDTVVAFVGSWNGYGHAEWWPQRERMLKHVDSWYGPGFRCFPDAGRPAVRGMDLQDLYASTDVVVGDSCLVPNVDGSPCTRYWSDRVPETIGRGGLLVHPWVEGMADDLPVLTYPLGDMDELKPVIEEALSWNKFTRDAVRQRGIDYVLAHDTYTHRMRQLWKLLGL